MLTELADILIDIETRVEPERKITFFLPGLVVTGWVLSSHTVKKLRERTIRETESPGDAEYIIKTEVARVARNKERREILGEEKPKGDNAPPEKIYLFRPCIRNQPGDPIINELFIVDPETVLGFSLILS